MRNMTILCCLLLSVLLGTAAILSRRWALQGVIFSMGCVWTFADMVMSGAFRKSYWKARNVSVSQLYRDAKQGRITLPRQGLAIERVARIGSMIFMVTFFAMYFV
jgi:hypothetical protein